MRSAVIVATVVLTALAGAPEANAYKLIGERWPQATINVSSEAPRYTKSVRRAVKLWNRAKLPVRFRLTPSAQARVIFRYSGGSGFGRTGCAGVAGGTGAGYPGIDLPVLEVLVIRGCRSRRLRDFTAMHELGHALGLGHENRRCALDERARERAIRPGGALPGPRAYRAETEAHLPHQGRQARGAQALREGVRA